MLTHVHLLVHTLWCWHTLRKRWSLKSRERMGSALFKKMKCIFSIAPVGNLEKSRECSSLRNTHWTLAVEAPDVEALRPVCCGARVKHQTQGDSCSCVRCYLTSAGVLDWKHRTLRERPVVCVWCPTCLAMLSGFKTGEHRTCSASGDLAHLQTSMCLGPVYTGRVRWHLAQRPVLCRLPLDSNTSFSEGDTWLTLEHRTQVLSVRCPFKSVQ